MDLYPPILFISEKGVGFAQWVWPLLANEKATPGLELGPLVKLLGEL